MKPQFTASQQAAILCTDVDSSILAGAGSGKTMVLVEKVALLVEKLHVPVESILVVTFTDKAAEEIKERIGKRLKGHRSPEGQFVGTLHGFASLVLSQAASGEFRVMNEFLSNLERLRSAKEGLLKSIERNNAEAINAVERFGLRGAIRYFLDVLSLRSTDVETSQIPYGEVGQAVRKVYSERKKNLNLLDFDDLEDGLLDFLKGPSGQDLKERYRWIIVDEFQDTSPIQWEILEALHTPPRTRLVIVGDPRQSIYRFRGADPSLFLKVTREMESRGGHLFSLRENFRSAASVIDTVNRTSEPLFPKDFPPLIATRTDAGLVDIVPVPESRPIGDMRRREAELVSDRLSALRDAGHLWNGMALLFRTRRAVAVYEDLFKERAIPYKTSLGEPLLERPEILSLLFLMKKLGGSTERELPLIEEGLRHSRVHDFGEDISTSPLSDFLTQFFDKTSERFPLQVRRNIAAFHELAKDLLTLGVQNLKTLVEYLDSLRDEKARIVCPSEPETKDAVSLMTVHASKGLEFPIVVLCDTAASAPRPHRLFIVSGGEIALKEKDAEAAGLKDRLVKNDRFEALEKKEQAQELEESKRLLYVALTRARDRLILPLPVDNSEKDKKKQIRQNSWSEWLQP